MKKTEMQLKEYCQKLSDENLKFLAGRLNQRLFGDTAEVLDFLSNIRDVDRWLSTAENSTELFDMLDTIEEVVTKECQNRNAVVA